MTTIKIAAVSAALLFALLPDAAGAKPVPTFAVTFNADGKALPQIGTKKVSRVKLFHRARVKNQRLAKRLEESAGRSRFLVHPGFATIRSGKTGATALVSAKFSAAFQGYVDDLEAAGAVIRFMGGRSASRTYCSRPRHKHGCGEALDVCQTGWGRIDTRCRLPGRHRMAALARARGLQEGGEWCSDDLGHAEAGPGVGACSMRWPRIAGRKTTP